MYDVMNSGIKMKIVRTQLQIKRAIFLKVITDLGHEVGDKNLQEQFTLPTWRKNVQFSIILTAKQFLICLEEDGVVIDQ